MSVWKKGKKAVTSLFLAVLLAASALGAGALLGRFYIDTIISEAQQEEKNPAKAAVGQGDSLAKLPLLPFYTIQVGGIDLPESEANYLTESLGEAGCFFYKTLTPPRRILVGVFTSREQAQIQTDYLLGQNFGARTVTLMLNQKDSLDGTAIKPLLFGYSNWLQETSLLWEVYVEGEDFREVFINNLSRTYSAYQALDKTRKNSGSPPEFLAEPLSGLNSAIANYMIALQILSKEWSLENYAFAQGALLEIIDYYQIMSDKALKEDQV